MGRKCFVQDAAAFVSDNDSTIFFKLISHLSVLYHRVLISLFSTRHHTSPTHDKASD